MSDPRRELVKEAREEVAGCPEPEGCTLCGLFGQLADALDSALNELEAAKEVLFECYREAGADTDGARTLSDMGAIRPGIEVLAIQAVTELRKDYDDA